MEVAVTNIKMVWFYMNNDVNPSAPPCPCSNTEEQQKQTKKQRGATFVEYILLVTLIALAAVAVLRIFGQTVSTKFSGLNATILATS